MRYFLIPILLVFFLVACSDNTQTATSQNSSTSATVVSTASAVDIPFIEDPATATISYPDTNVYYGKNGEIWVYNPKIQSKKKIIDNAFGNFLSPDKTKFVYWVPHNEIKTEFGDSATSYHIYDIKIGDSSVLLKEALTYPNFHYEQWSPDSRYLIFDAGTSHIREKYIVDTIAKQEIANFTDVGGDFFWLNDNEIVFNSEEKIKSGDHFVYRAMIESINITNGKKNIILNEEKYYCLDVIKGQILMQSYKNNEDKYWLINNDGTDKIEVEKDKYETTTEKKRKDVSELEAMARSLLPEPYDKYKYLWVTRGKDGWILIQVNQNRDWNNDIFIMDINNSKSLKKIDNGDGATW